jgi:hypothetical protein
MAELSKKRGHRLLIGKVVSDRKTSDPFQAP